MLIKSIIRYSLYDSFLTPSQRNFRFKINFEISKLSEEFQKACSFSILKGVLGGKSSLLSCNTCGINAIYFSVFLVKW